jgi:hypothetical protein
MVKADGKKVTADQILDLYAQAKKTKGIARKEEIMKQVIFLSKYLNDYLPKYSSK